MESKLALPWGKYDMPLVMMERALNPDGSLQYPGEWVVMKASATMREHERYFTSERGFIFSYYKNELSHIIPHLRALLALQRTAWSPSSLATSPSSTARRGP